MPFLTGSSLQLSSAVPSGFSENLIIHYKKHLPCLLSFLVCTTNCSPECIETRGFRSCRRTDLREHSDECRCLPCREKEGRGRFQLAKAVSAEETSTGLLAIRGLNLQGFTSHKLGSSAAAQQGYEVFNFLDPARPALEVKPRLGPPALRDVGVAPKPALLEALVGVVAWGLAGCSV